MLAFAIDNFGQSGSVRELPTPEPARGEVRVRVSVAGVNPVDGAVAEGYLKDMLEHRFPLVPGVDASGVVDAVGEGVDTWVPGDEVFGAVGRMYFGEGTYAEFAAMSAGTIARRPGSVGHPEAASIPTPGVTALTMLEALALGQNEILLAIGAPGGVGSFLIQLAARRGARVIAVCRGENADYVRGLGATDVIDYTAEEVGEALRSRYPDEIDAIADMVGQKEEVTRLSERVRPGGRVASCVGGADEVALGQRGIKATNVSAMVTSEQLAMLAQMLADGRLQSPPIQPFFLPDAGDALLKIASRHVRGKLVLSVHEPTS
jgi:NADPH:quinone reductase-like Zn-dependent oxidoreductase